MAGFLQTTVYVVVLAVIYQQVSKLFETTLPIHTGGYAAQGWEKVSDLYKQLVETGVEKGGIFTVYYKGELVVEAYGGYADEEAQVVLDRETLVQYFSTTKFTGGLVMAMLVDRGLMSYDDLVTDHWPEFAQNGKESVTVKQLISFQAGLAAVDPFSFYDLRDDPEKLGDILAAAKPNWTPGEHHGYHAITFGLYLDQLVRRIDPQHRNLAQFFHEEVAEPFDIDFYIGLPKNEVYRTARLYSTLTFLSLDMLFNTKYYRLNYDYFFNPSSLHSKAIRNPPETVQHGIFNHPSFREIPCASTHGFGTGASIAKLFGILANGGTYGDQELLSSELIDKLARPVVSGIDHVMLFNITYGLGTYIREATHGGLTFGFAGAGGQYGFADLKYRVGWSRATNHHTLYHMADSPHIEPIERAIYECVTAIEKS